MSWQQLIEKIEILYTLPPESKGGKLSESRSITLEKSSDPGDYLLNSPMLSFQMNGCAT
jgi:hypothetical protein